MCGSGIILCNLNGKFRNRTDRATKRLVGKCRGKRGPKQSMASSCLLCFQINTPVCLITGPELKGTVGVSAYISEM